MTREDTLLDDALARQWYHTIELAPGRATHGAVDLRATAPKLLPDTLRGLRALDVGTFDGFWAFELERRGAETVAIDVDSFDQADWPPLNRERLAAEARSEGPGQRFGLAREVLGAKVERVPCSIYDLVPERIGGSVDFVVVSDVLLHLRDPVKGLEQVRGALRPGGRLLVSEQFNVLLTLSRPRRAAASFQARGTNYNWWEPNLTCYRDWLALAGFDPPHRRTLFRLKAAVKGQARMHVALEVRAGGT